MSCFVRGYSCQKACDCGIGSECIQCKDFTTAEKIAALKEALKELTGKDYVEYRPVVRGKWIQSMLYSVPTRACSVCGMIMPDFWKGPYCECGALMEKKG